MIPRSRRSFLQQSAQLAGATAVLSRWNNLPRLFTDQTALQPAIQPAAQIDISLCRKLAADPLRPQYHLLPTHNWMNDPNGPIFYRGRYHMFYQYNPQGAIWGNMHWAHATSPDMIHWQHEPIAIAPTPGGYDSDGVFSGSAVLDRARPTVIYTGVAPPTSNDATLRDGTHTWREVQCVAVAEDNDLRSWKKLPDPVIATPPAGLAVTGFRDPCPWREGDKWMLALGSGTIEHGGMALLYTSSDLRHWTYLHPLVEDQSGSGKTSNPVDTGHMWECPDFFPLGDKHVLLFSTKGKVHWKVGMYSKQRFTPEKEGVVDWGSYYAAKTMLDKNGRRILWGWITETRPNDELIAAGWAGAMSLPRMLSLSANNELQTEPAPDFHILRGERSTIDKSLPAADREKKFAGLRIHDLCAELDLILQPKGDEFRLLLQSESGETFAAISCVTRSTQRELQINAVSAPLPGASNLPVHLHLLLDGSVLETFTNQTTALTARVYQTPSSPLRLKLEGEVELVSFEVGQINPISKDRLTGCAA